MTSQPELPDVSKLDIAASPNPWKDTETTEKPAPEPSDATSDATSDKHATTGNVIVPPAAEDQEESIARNAWASSESHPPPPPTERTPSPPNPPEKEEKKELPEPDAEKDTKPPATPTKDKAAAATDDQTPTTPIASPTSGFPSLSTIFSIPAKLSRSRPNSMDGKAVSPQTPSNATVPAEVPQATLTAPPMDRTATSSDALDASTSEEPQFDFQKFLEQMNTRSAEPVSKYLKSFLSNFAKRTFTVNDQIKIINDFLNFIAARMRECEPWRRASDLEFDHSMEGMEKLVMNRLYDFTFTPQLPKTVPPRPVTTDDLERDRVLAQRIALFGWIEEKHLDVPEGEGSKGFLMFAQQELLKINHYKAPRDKVICILNCCKVIFGLIRHLKLDEGADAFLPILIFVVLKANPEHLLSNVEFINRFRNPEKLQSEAGYYLSSLMGGVSFIETMDHTSLSNISQEDFERNVENAIQNLPKPPESPIVTSAPATPSKSGFTPPLSPRTPHAGEESAMPLSLPSPSAQQTFTDDARRIFQKTGDTISKPISAIGKIFSDALDGAEAKFLPGPFAPFELGREQRQESEEKRQIFLQQQQQAWQQYSGGSPGGPSSGMSSSAAYPQTPFNNGQGPYPQPPIQTPYKPRVRRNPPSGRMGSGSPANSVYYDQSPEVTPSRPPPIQSQSHPNLGVGRPPQFAGLGSGVGSAHVSRTPTPNLDLDAVQDEINQATEHAVVAARETLKQMFPTTEDDVINLVLEASENDLGKSIDKLLEMSSGV